jgi:hypothetical protein
LRKDYPALIENRLIERLAKSANSLTLQMIIKLLRQSIKLFDGIVRQSRARGRIRLIHPFRKPRYPDFCLRHEAFVAALAASAAPAAPLRKSNTASLCQIFTIRADAAACVTSHCAGPSCRSKPAYCLWG